MNDDIIYHKEASSVVNDEADVAFIATYWP